MSSKKHCVCVTGASGYIASHIVQQLLQQGHTVHGTVRNLDDKVLCDHLRSLENAESNLRLFQADLLGEKAKDDFVAAIKGCDVVMHTASPFFLGAEEDEVCKPAVDGTRTVMEATKECGVTRLILTSSRAAVIYRAKDSIPKDHVHSTRDWSDETFMRENKAFYPLSKTLAEKLAWKLADEYGVWMTSINPALVIGEMLHTKMNTSIEWLLKYLNGTVDTIPQSTMGWIDVVDVAELHIKAMELEKPEVVGERVRLFAMQSSMSWEDTCAMLRILRPSLPITTKVADGEKPIPMTIGITNEEKVLGRKFHTFEEMALSTIESLESKGFLEKSQK